MSRVYSTYEGKAKFSEILRRVREGERVLISYRGRPVAQVTPLDEPRPGLEERLRRLEAEGAIGQEPKPDASLAPIARRRGALKRFLETRD